MWVRIEHKRYVWIAMGAAQESIRLELRLQQARDPVQQEVSCGKVSWDGI